MDPPWDNGANIKGFTMVELIVVVAILGVLATMAIPFFNGYLNQSKSAAAMGDIRTLSTEISAYAMDKGRNPDKLDDINRKNFLDPWKRPYAYEKTPVLMDKANFDTLNTDFDVYSMGVDGTSFPAGGDTHNDDDIVRTNDGAFVGMRQSI
jgi:general secretion pathway protein G